MLNRLLRFLAIFMLALAVFGAAAPVRAESREWVSDPPKQPIGDFMLCVGYAEANGVSYRNTNYIHNDVLGNCDRYAREDTVRYFRFAHGIELDPASVQVTVRRP